MASAGASAKKIQIVVVGGGAAGGNLIGGKMAIEGRLARFVYTSLYRMHLFAVHGWARAIVLIVIGQVNSVIRPRLKLH